MRVQIPHFVRNDKVILGTAGHIDHGKTALVRALTGVDTDRLPEEKRRGITIDLGFAPLRLATAQGEITLGVVDVPGHEAFVRTMLAGASGVELALLVIAADEGPMPQTREHLAILQLLDVRTLIVALTKSDLVEREWLQLVTDDVQKLLADTRFAGARIVATSVVSGDGLDELRGALADAARSAQPKSDDDVFRLPVDRAFSVRGTGTVVTGTVWSGTLAPEQSVRVLPGGATARVRGVQNHGVAVPRLEPGMRAAVALAGVDPHAVARGTALVAGAEWEATLVLRADLTTLADAPELRPRTRVRFHLGTADVGARIIAAGTPVAPGTSRPVRIVLDEPIVVRGGDRFVLRSASPLATIGGGTITDANAPRRARPLSAVGVSLEQRLAIFAREAGAHGIAESSLPVRAGIPPSRLQKVLASVQGISRVGERWYATAVLDDIRARIVDAVRSHHDAHPLESGAPRQDVRSRLGIDADLFDELVSDLSGAKKLIAVRAELRLPGRGTELSAAQQKTADALLAVLVAANTEPPSVPELEHKFGPQTRPLLRHLERQERVVRIEDTRYYTPAAVRELLTRLERALKGKGQVAPTELREVLGFSRKFLIPFLEYCDRTGYTVRQGKGRVWRDART